MRRMRGCTGCLHNANRAICLPANSFVGMVLGRNALVSIPLLVCRIADSQHRNVMPMVNCDIGNIVLYVRIP